MPTVSPSFIVTSNQSAIVVTWELLTLIEARGFIEYLIHLHEEFSVERQSMQLPMSEDSATFTGLEMCARYEVSMGTRTLSSGATGPGMYMHVITRLSIGTGESPSISSGDIALSRYRISLNNGPGIYYLYSLPAPGVKLRQAFI